jgi:hypothetical protein
MGCYVAANDGSFPNWNHSADHFSVSPMTAEQFIARWSEGLVS